MKINEVLGKKIIDKNVREIGKVAEMTFDSETFELVNIYAVIGNALSKKYFKLSPNSILAIGDFMQISNKEEELKEQIIDKIPAGELTVDSIVGKKVIDINANEIGKINNIEIDIDSHKITELIVSKSASIGKTLNNKITKEDVKAFGDYILLNKELKYEEKEKKEETTDDEEEKVKVNIE